LAAAAAAHSVAVLRVGKGVAPGKVQAEAIGKSFRWYGNDMDMEFEMETPDPDTVTLTSKSTTSNN